MKRFLDALAAAGHIVDPDRNRFIRAFESDCGGWTYAHCDTDTLYFAVGVFDGTHLRDRAGRQFIEDRAEAIRAAQALAEPINPRECVQPYRPSLRGCGGPAIASLSSRRFNPA